ncbi:MAG: SMP-30/gluconolactonase/LRE family protein, partial [Deltaproteobacteria bacterium]|nr:SMP-30/gluconolactonase/LRE family protein [Deltaproteobacteria bacterium]
DSVVADGAVITLVSDGFSFAEGPASDAVGNLYFSDITESVIYKWSIDYELSVFRKNSGGANGLFFDSSGNLQACEGGNQQIVAMDSSANVTVLIDEYDSLPFNEPNDLWLAPDDGVYFTDPVYFATEVPQSGEHVYYLLPDRSSTIRVIDDMTRPNGIVGSADGNTLYVTDHGAGETYSYAVNSDGTLSDK